MSRKTWSCVYGAHNLSSRTHEQVKLARGKLVHCTHEQVKLLKELVKENLIVCAGLYSVKSADDVFT